MCDDGLGVGGVVSSSLGRTEKLERRLPLARLVLHA